MCRHTDRAGHLTRRSLIGSAIGLALAPSIGFARVNVDEAEIDRVKGIAEKAGLRGFQVSKNDQYLAIGNASDEFRKVCLKCLLGLSKDYKEHFKFKGFKLTEPKGRLTVIMLADRGAFSKYLGKPPDEAVAGTYDPDANDLLWFDNRDGTDDPLGAKINTMVLTHEATHQLTFNTGLLRRDGDIPKVIAEGLANYAEMRSPDGKKPKIGDFNIRIEGYRAGFGGKQLTMPPVESLLRDDQRIEAVATQVDAYAEAWLLVHYLMTNKKMLPKFRDYLKEIQARAAPQNRMEDWVKHMGDLKAFDRDLTDYLRAVKPKK